MTFSTEPKPRCGNIGGVTVTDHFGAFRRRWDSLRRKRRLFFGLARNALSYSCPSASNAGSAEMPGADAENHMDQHDCRTALPPRCSGDRNGSPPSCRHRGLARSVPSSPYRHYRTHNSHCGAARLRPAMSQSLSQMSTLATFGSAFEISLETTSATSKTVTI